MHLISPQDKASELLVDDGTLKVRYAPMRIILPLPTYAYPAFFATATPCAYPGTVILLCLSCYRYPLRVSCYAILLCVSCYAIPYTYSSTTITLRVSCYATPYAYPATRVRRRAFIRLWVPHPMPRRYPPTRTCYALATRCPVLTSSMLLRSDALFGTDVARRAYALATRCPVRWRWRALYHNNAQVLKKKSAIKCIKLPFQYRLYRDCGLRCMFRPSLRAWCYQPTRVLMLCLAHGATSLRACYAKSGTDLAYGATRLSRYGTRTN
eukprot:2862299-Rhodomonas_salina.1